MLPLFYGLILSAVYYARSETRPNTLVMCNGDNLVEDLICSRVTQYFSCFDQIIDVTVNFNFMLVYLVTVWHDEFNLNGPSHQWRHYFLICCNPLVCQIDEMTNDVAASCSKMPRPHSHCCIINLTLVYLTLDARCDCRFKDNHAINDYESRAQISLQNCA